MKNKFKNFLSLSILSLGLLFSFNAFATTVTFTPTGASSTWSVPAGVTSITLTAVGGKGGAAFGLGYMGYGGVATGTLAVSPGQTYYYWVGSQSVDNSGVPGTPGGGLGYEGGGGMTWFSNQGAFSTSTVILVGAGGAGGTRDIGKGTNGGDAGGLTGFTGQDDGTPCFGGHGGTQTAGGTASGNSTAGTAGQGGQSITYGSGGGAGYYGGGAGYCAASAHAAGGGGSSYMKSTLTATSTASGVNITDGYLTITYNVSTPSVNTQISQFIWWIRNLF